MKEKDFLRKHEGTNLSQFVFSKVQPQALELEAAVLGAIMLDRKALAQVASFLKPEHFYTRQNRIIFWAFLKLRKKGDPIDLLTVTEFLRLEQIGKNNNEQSCLDFIGGPHYLVEMTDRVASAANIEAHAHIVMDKWRLRTLIESATQTIRDCYIKESGEVYTELTKALISLSAGTTSKLTTLRKAQQKMLDKAHLAKQRKGKILGRNQTGIEPYEKITNGGEGGDFHVIGARPSIGKSSLVNNHLNVCVENDRPLYIWSGEMPDHQTATRSTAARSKVNSLSIRGGDFIEDEEMTERQKHEAEEMRTVIEAAMLKVQENKSEIYLDTGAKDLDDLVNTVITLRQTKEVRDFIFDRLELINLHKLHRDINEAVGIVTKRFRSLSTEMPDCTFTLIAQMRKSADKNPNGEVYQDDLLGSSHIVNDALKVTLIERPEKYGYERFADDNECTGLAKLKVVKNTNGIIDEVIVRFTSRLTLFEPITGELNFTDDFKDFEQEGAMPRPDLDDIPF